MSPINMGEMTFQEATAIQQRIERDLESIQSKLDAFPRKEMGLVPDEIRSSDEYRSAKEEWGKAWNQYRVFNGWYTKAFKSQLQEQRRQKVGSRSL